MALFITHSSVFRDTYFEVTLHTGGDNKKKENKEENNKQKEKVVVLLKYNNHLQKLNLLNKKMWILPKNYGNFLKNMSIAYKNICFFVRKCEKCLKNIRDCLKIFENYLEMQVLS